MKKIILATILCFAISNGLNAQATGETWSLDKIKITETTANDTIYREITDTLEALLLGLLGPEEIVFVSANELSYKRIGGDDFEIFPYTRNGKALEIELTECSIKLDMEIIESEMNLSENKDINENHTVTITYSYTK